MVKQLTNQIIGSNEYAAEEEDGWRDAVVHPEDHVIDDRFVDQVADFYKARYSGHQAEYCHLVKLLGSLL